MQEKAFIRTFARPCGKGTISPKRRKTAKPREQYQYGARQRKAAFDAAATTQHNKAARQPDAERRRAAFIFPSQGFNRAPNRA